MRLGQLARKLSLRPAQIVEFLALNNIQIVDDSNTRIEDNHTELVVNHFAPGKFQQITEIVEEAEETVLVENEPQVTEPEVSLPETSEQPTNSEAEIIRVPKIELSGLKVLGKIELPEPKKKEPVVENTEEGIEPAAEIPSSVPVAPERKPKNHNRKLPVHQKRDRPREWKNPLEQQREREIREAEEKKRIAAEREKERRRSHYEEKRKNLAQTKRAKAVKEQAIVQKKPVDTRPVPKTWFGKFLRWWTT